MAINPNNWKWFGSPGHFNGGAWCRFHLCTQVGKYVISTVGEYVHPRHSKGNEEDDTKWSDDNFPGEDIGVDRKYETMVFLAGKPCDWEKCMCGKPEILGQELDSQGYNIASEATSGHMELCKKWASSLYQKKGE